jgi:carboxyl-terminal processing protease
MKIANLVLFTLFAQSSLAFAETNAEVLDKIWAIGKTKSCTSDMRARFDDAALERFKTEIRDQDDRDSLAAILNPFLFSFGHSHTQFFTSKSESYYLFKGYYAEVTPSAPPPPLIVNPGIQVGTDEHGYFVREALDGLPAKAGGLLKGDRILSVDGVPFTGFFGFQPKAQVVLRILHQGHPRDITLPLPALNWSQAFQDATLASMRVLPYKGHSVGYVRLWSGVHPESASALWAAVKRFKAAKVDRMVLDLRGGYGGAFWDHLDPFFADRRDFFVMKATDGDGVVSELKPEQHENKDAFLGPMVVLIDEGSRSGKEAMAYQFKKSKRAVLLGTNTAGYFAGGGTFLVDQPSDYMLYLCVMRDSTLDGVEIEGVGVSPDVAVPFTANGALRDSQLEAGLETLYGEPVLVHDSEQPL